LGVSGWGGEGMTKLYAPEKYWKMTPEEKSKICNGAGPKGFGWVVPDKIWGVCITESANIHDFMYEFGKDIYDKDEADRVFLNNMVRQIMDADHGFMGWLLTDRRLKIAHEYYECVHVFGGIAFWAGKNKPENLGNG
jgi:hypothetical protein